MMMDNQVNLLQSS